MTQSQVTGKIRCAAFISGRGSNMMALVEAAKAPDFPAEFVLVMSNDPAAGGLDWAAGQGLAAIAVDHRLFGKDREGHERAIDAVLEAHGVEFICLAGYMRVLTPWLVEKWQGRMINIHPALLPDFKGLHTHQRCLDAGHERHGATVHWVTPGVDEGGIIAQAEVPVLAGDTADMLAARVLVAEHRLYSTALRQVLANLTKI
ncbi:phosphoribosylglycinamide formyltransferase [Asticcacaulis sp. AC402]|uniref:phosphoribosylglycinamide formyltransferase n=1 Tax=Asticcacaulis sp. AC402 TaxID=1282361 RepID=UPI0003C3F63B|nr:phosphoribosylglycinamide formyltransferase [Asticcacaulis sp. AC402]ESQ73886.1 phosphoribosylglycinamide formyltransferase [Asticcacaulis sp. AC402]